MRVGVIVTGTGEALRGGVRVIHHASLFVCRGAFAGTCKRKGTRKARGMSDVDQSVVEVGSYYDVHHITSHHITATTSTTPDPIDSTM